MEPVTVSLGNYIRKWVEHSTLACKRMTVLRIAGVGDWFIHGGARRTATATPFDPRRATKDREEHLSLIRGGRGERRLQWQHLLSTEGHRGPRRTATATATPFIREGARRAAKNGNCNGNTFCPRRATKDREERLSFIRGGNYWGHGRTPLFVKVEPGRTLFFSCLGRRRAKWLGAGFWASQEKGGQLTGRAAGVFARPGFGSLSER